MEIPLIAGRFAPLAGCFALDLATGERACLAIEAVPDEEEHRAWTERCAALCGLWHPDLAECLDFGPLGAGHRFAAYAVSRRAAMGEPSAWQRARSQVEAFLSACGLETCTAGTPFADAADRLLVMPAVDVEGRERAAPPAAAPTGIPPRSTSFGIRLVGRPVLLALVEHLTLDPPPGIAVVSIDAAVGAGGRTLLRACAREARRHGYVPVSTAALRWMASRPEPAIAAWTAALARHHLAVLHDGRQRPFRHTADAWEPLLRMGARQSRARIVLELTARGSPVSRFHLAPLAERELIDMVVLAGDSPRLQARLERAAGGCGGRPGRFVRSVARLLAAGEMSRKPARYTVHERAATYGEDDGPLALHERRGLRIEPSSGGGALLVNTPPVDQAIEDVLRQSARYAGRGRHAAADRSLRQAHAMAVRRQQWAGAADAAMSRALIRASRGRVADAERLLIDALECSGRLRAPARSIAALTRIGLLQLEDARVEQAESSLRSAAAAASLMPDSPLESWIGSALALCLWWQGRCHEAQRALPGDEPSGVMASRGGAASATPGMPSACEAGVLRCCTAARIALSLDEPAAARRWLDRAADAAAPAGAAAQAMVRRMEARWHAAVGDAAAFRVAAGDAVRLAAVARRPLDRLRAMVGSIEGASRLDDLSGCSATARRLESAARRALPGLLAFRIRLVLGLLRGGIPVDRATVECAARRLNALAPCHPTGAARPASPSHARSPMYEDVIEVLGICQEEEPAGALERVLEIVRKRTRAAAAEFVSAEGGLTVTVPRGVRPPSIGRRVIDSGLPIEPSVTDRGTEAGVPLRFGGRVIGALTCRWLGGLPLEVPALVGLLAAVGAAAAPSLHAALDRHRPAGPPGPGALELLGESAGMREIRQAVLRAADAPFPVLVQGESGSGKELVARAIHRAGPRRGKVFCALNCAALPDDLLEAELFGHARGAFTGAAVERAGLFEEADGGVLFLDEVGELTPRGQAKLLRAIQEGEIKRLGETFARKVDVRIIAATNRPLDQAVAAGLFRRDLRYRLDVIRIGIPPLRDRPEDIPLLAQSLWRSAAARVGSRAVLSGAVLAALARYDWPGNVRELQNVLAALAVASSRRGIVGPAALPATLASTAVRGSATTLEEARRVVEERYVRAALARSGGHRGRAAAELGLTRQGLAKLMGRLGVNALEAAAPAAHSGPA